jgi:8-oxo-dGTP pyrophosphatase MutT (NUDIX family)
VALEPETVQSYPVPRLPASAGALIFDESGRLLLLKPTYKSGWTVPGGQMEADGETPWEACRREVREETGLVVSTGRLVVVDFLRPHGSRPGGIRFLFDCGALSSERFVDLTLEAQEISESRLVEPDQAVGLLSGPVGRRVAAALRSSSFVYLEDGRHLEDGTYLEDGTDVPNAG